jgi:hypothetical protein
VLGVARPGIVEWHLAHIAALGIPACAVVAAPRWQTVHATPWCFAWGNAIGCRTGEGGNTTIQAAATSPVTSAAPK